MKFFKFSISISIFLITSLHAGLWKNEIFIKNNTANTWSDKNTKKTIRPESRESVFSFSRKGFGGKDIDQEYKGILTSEGQPTIIFIVTYSESRGLRVMVRNEKNTENTSDWIAVPTGNGKQDFAISPELYATTSFYSQALQQDIELEIKDVFKAS